MKILQINSVCDFGSTGRIVSNIHSELLKLDIDSYVLYGRGDYLESKKKIKVSSKIDNAVHLFSSRLFDNHGLSSIKSTMKLIDNISEIGPDVIHLHNIHGYYLNYEVLFEYLKRINIPVVWTLHDSWAYTGHCAYYDYIKCNKWVDECGNCEQIGSYPKSLIKDNSKINFEKKKNAFLGVNNLTIVTPSQWLAQEVKSSFLSKYKVEVINNGVDVNRFVISNNIGVIKNKLDIINKFVVLGVASIWEKRKGFNCFLELSKILPNNVVIILIGLTRKQIKELPSNIIGIMRTKDIQELSDYYSLADVFVNPTLEDNFPTTNLEALSCNTFGITFDVGGSPEAYDKNTGIIIPPGNIEELSNAIISRINNVSVTNLCRDRAINLYSHYDSLKKYIDLYSKIIG